MERSIYSLNLRIQSEYRKIRIRNTSEFGHFSCSEFVCMFVRKKKISSFEITVIIFKAYEKCKSPIQYQNILFLLF